MRSSRSRGWRAARPRRSMFARATRSSRRASASTPRRRSSTSNTAASCRTCYASFWRSNLPGFMPLPETLRKLLSAPGPSGYEQAPAAVFREAAAAFGAQIEYDSVGSTVARVAGTGDGPTVAVVGHIDEIGLIIHHIDDDGYLWFTGVGGGGPHILLGPRGASAGGTRSSSSGSG